jgi:hypothetical protein
MFPGLCSAIQFPYGKRVYIELGYLVRVSDQADELPLRSCQGRIRHHVEQADMKFPYVLALCPLERQHYVTVLLQS